VQLLREQHWQCAAVLLQKVPHELPSVLRSEELPGLRRQGLEGVSAATGQREESEGGDREPASSEPEAQQQIHIWAAGHQEVTQNCGGPSDALLRGPRRHHRRVLLPGVQRIQTRLALLRRLLPLDPLGLRHRHSPGEAKDRGQR